MAKKTTANWFYQGKEITSIKDIPENVLGVIYKIYNLDTQMYYVGRRTIRSNRRRKLTLAEKKIKGNEKKTFITEMKEASGWKSYAGSNLTLKAEVAKGARIRKEILHYCYSKAEITYKETAEILCSGALLDSKSYNSWVKATIYKKHLMV